MGKDILNMVLLSGIIVCSFTVGYLTKNVSDSTPEFLKIAILNAQEHKYDLEKYNCVNFSNDLVNAYEGLYTARVVNGWMSAGSYCEVDNSKMVDGGLPIETLDNTSCAGGHAWVEVTIPIEATTGEIIRR